MTSQPTKPRLNPEAQAFVPSWHNTSDLEQLMSGLNTSGNNGSAQNAATPNVQNDPVARAEAELLALQRKAMETTDSAELESIKNRMAYWQGTLGRGR